MIRRTLLLIVLASALLGVAGVVQHAEAQAPNVGMTLGASGPVDCNAQGCTVASADPFTVTIHADPAPQFEMSGFGAEVVFSGLVWFMRDCEEQLLIDRADGGDVAACAQAPGGAGQARVTAISEIAAPPLSPFDELSDGDAFFELSARCPEAGTFEVILTAVNREDAATDAPFGAIYFRNDTTEFPVRTQGTRTLDLEADGNPREVAVADTLTITCQGGGGVGRQSPVPVGTNTVPTPPPPQDGTPGNQETANARASATAQTTPGETDTLSPEDATATAIAAANAGGSDDDEDDDSSIWLWAIVGGAIAAVAAGLGLLAWRRYRAGGAGPGAGGSPGDSAGAADQSPPAGTA